MKSILLFLCFLFTFSTSLCAQETDNSFWAQSEFSAGYHFVDTWSRCENSSTDFCEEEGRNEVRSFSIAYSYKFKNNFLAQFNYFVDQEKHYDLQRTFYNASYFLRVGYQFEINGLNSLIPKLGIGVILKPDYGVYRTGIVGQPVETYTSQIRYFGKTAFAHWTFGLEYRHRLTEKVFVGLSLNVANNSEFKYGRTYFSSYIGMNLGRNRD